MSKIRLKTKKITNQKTKLYLQFQTQRLSTIAGLPGAVCRFRRNYSVGEKKKCIYIHIYEFLPILLSSKWLINKLQKKHYIPLALGFWLTVFKYLLYIVPFQYRKAWVICCKSGCMPKVEMRLKARGSTITKTCNQKTSPELPICRRTRSNQSSHNMIVPFLLFYLD